MSKIKEAFAGGKAFIPFITCGDPDLETTEKIIEAMAESGADLIELGIPFSDPTAEGTVIQEGNLRALSGGVTTDKVFDMVRRVRQKVKSGLQQSSLIMSCLSSSHTSGSCSTVSLRRSSG